MSEVNKALASNEKSIYLDTSFILYSLGDFIDRNTHIAEQCTEILGVLFNKKNACCYISNVVLNELFHALERIGFQEFIDGKIIALLGIDRSTWISYTRNKRIEKRKDHSMETGLNINKIKEWRCEGFKADYKTLVIDQYENIVDSLSSLPGGIKCISNFSSPQNIPSLFLACHKKYSKLDSNDVNHYLLAKEHTINSLLSTDGDFKQIIDKNLTIIVVDRDFSLYLES